MKLIAIALTKLKAFRDALVALGWLPPEGPVTQGSPPPRPPV